MWFRYNLWTHSYQSTSTLVRYLVEFLEQGSTGSRFFQKKICKNIFYWSFTDFHMHHAQSASKNVFLNCLVLFNKNKIRRILIIFNFEKWLWKSLNWLFFTDFLQKSTTYQFIFVLKIPPLHTAVLHCEMGNGRMTISLLICTLISENQGLEKSRSYSNLRKISGPANLDFFQVYSINLAFFLGGDLAGTEIFPCFETDLDFQKSRCRLKGRMRDIAFSN